MRNAQDGDAHAADEVAHQGRHAEGRSERATRQPRATRAQLLGVGQAESEHGSNDQGIQHLRDIHLPQRGIDGQDEVLDRGHRQSQTKETPDAEAQRQQAGGRQRDELGEGGDGHDRAVLADAAAQVRGDVDREVRDPEGRPEERKRADPDEDESRAVFCACSCRDGSRSVSVETGTCTPERGTRHRRLRPPATTNAARKLTRAASSEPSSGPNTKPNENALRIVALTNPGRLSASRTMTSCRAAKACPIVIAPALTNTGPAARLSQTDGEKAKTSHPIATHIAARRMAGTREGQRSDRRPTTTPRMSPSRASPMKNRPTRGRATWRLPARYSVIRGSVDEVARERHTMIRRKARYSRLCQTLVRTSRRSLTGLFLVRIGCSTINGTALYSLRAAMLIPG